MPLARTQCIYHNICVFKKYYDIPEYFCSLAENIITPIHKFNTYFYLRGIEVYIRDGNGPRADTGRAGPIFLKK